MSCFNNNSLNIDSYCDKCKMILNFSADVCDELEIYLKNGGHLSNFTELHCEIFIPILRNAIKKSILNISDLNEKQNSDHLFYSQQLSGLFFNIPNNLEEKDKYITHHSGFASIVISKMPWFEQLIKNIGETYLPTSSEP